MHAPSPRTAVVVSPPSHLTRTCPSQESLSVRVTAQTAGLSPDFRHTVLRRSTVLGAAVLSAVSLALSGCSPNPEKSDGVELVASSDPSPGMTFELRFGTPMVSPSQIGVALTNSPLAVRPRLAGSFTWLSERSGVFTPAEPLALDTAYELSLAPGLTNAAGKPSAAALRHLIRTPALEIAGSTPTNPNTNAPSDPQVRLLFNDDVRAADAQPYLFFCDNAGHRVSAVVCQGTREELGYELTNQARNRIWREDHRKHPNFHEADGDETSDDSPTNQVPNLLIAGPSHNLPIGKGWRLVAAAGLPGGNRPLKLRKALDVSIGDVTPFNLVSVEPQNYIHGGPEIRLNFSKPIPGTVTNGIAGWLDIQPQPANLTVRAWGRAVVLRGDFAGGKHYALDVHRDFQAVEPFPITGDTHFELQMPHVPPRLYFPAFSRDQLSTGNRTFPLLSVNVPQVRVRAKVLDPSAAIYALNGYSSYFIRWNERLASDGPGEEYRPINYNLLAGRTVYDQKISPTAEADSAQTTGLKWDEILAGRKTGVVFLDAQRVSEKSDSDPLPPLGTQAIIQLTDLGMVWKQGADGVDVFAFSLHNGQALPGANARLYSDENVLLQEAKTDTNGWARLAANTNADWIAVQSGDDFHALPLLRERVWMTRLDIPCTGDNEPGDPRRVLLFSDRHLYRPGEPVHLYGLVRQWGDTALEIPTNRAVTIECADRRGKNFFQTNVALTASGSYALTVPLPGNLHGDCFARWRLGTNEYLHSFSVQEFQPDAFLVQLTPTNVAYAGQPITVPVSARYFFGKPLSRAQIKWSIQASDSTFQPQGYEDFQFSKSDELSGRRRYHPALSLAGEGTLTAASNFVITADLPPNATAPQPRVVNVVAEVTDLNQQTITESADLLQHSSDFYLGLRQGASVLTNSESVPLEILALRADGQPWTNNVSAHLKLQRIDWRVVRLQGAGRSVRYHNEATATNIFESDIAVAPIRAPGKSKDDIAGNLIAGLPSLSAGEYSLEASAKDNAGRLVCSSLKFYVSAPDAVGRNYRNETELGLKPDQTAYAPGETAAIMVEAPFSGTALVTVEREKVLRSFSLPLQGNSPTIHVPLSPGDEPNVFVGVTLVRGSDESPHKVKEPEYRIGVCQLSVTNAATRLAVSVVPSATNCQPRDTMEVTVRVTDSNGGPVDGAEVVLYAVDEGILSLADPGLPQPHDFFYSPRPLAVQTSVSLPNLLSEDSEELAFQNKGYLVGGGGMERLRKKFLPCAFWQAGLATGHDGQTTVRFPVPDGMTRYRLCAVAHAASNRFGSGQSAFTVSKPLLIEPALPAFANINDQLMARAVVQNQTTNSGEIVATLETDDKVRNAPANRIWTKRIPLAANGSASLAFPVELGDTGKATWIWKVRFADAAQGAFEDSVQSVIEVGHVVPLLREAVLCHLTSGQTNLLAAADPQLLAGNGTVTVVVANTRLNDLGEAASQLLHYPYGCAEQTGSSLLPWIVLRDANPLLPALHHDTNEINTVIRAGIDRLFSMQTASGGLGYWPRASSPMLWASAYGAMVIALAQQRGIEMPEEHYDALLKYLSKELRAPATDPAEISDRCLALYAMALAGRPEGGYCEKLFTDRERLSLEDRALLALAISQGRGPEMMPGELLKPVTARERWNDSRFGCQARSQAIQLLAWTRYRPDSSILDSLVDDLMREQKEAHWTTTQGDAWALLALTEYARIAEGKLQPAAGTLEWNGASIPFTLGNGTNVFMCSFALTNAQKAPLTLTKTLGNRLYSRVLVETRPPETQLPRQDRGIGLARKYEYLDDDNQPKPVQTFRVGDRVLVTLDVSAREPARFVALDDALPAIFEAVNPEFKTRQARSAAAAEDGASWYSDYREFKKDRCLFFVDSLAPGKYTLRYIARVRAAGTVTAPPAKIEQMYHPERCGLSGTQVVSGQSLE